MDKGKALFSCIGLLTFAVTLTVFSALVNGWVLTMLWVWFITPIFSIRPLTIAEAIGIGLIISYLTYHSTKPNKSDSTDTAEIVINAVLQAIIPALTTLIFGWVVVQFM